MRTGSPAEIAEWFEEEAFGDGVLAIGGKVDKALLSGLAELGFHSGEPFIDPKPGRYWIPVDLRRGPSISQFGEKKVPRGKHQQAILCAHLAAQWWQALHDPILRFQNWLWQADVAGIPEPNAMTLATTGPQGQPSARMVLLKEATQNGFVFYTNYGSQKGRELEVNPRAALVFYWPKLGRQVRITGPVVKTSRRESEAYFHSRPRGAQLAARASWQSSPIPDREYLEARVRKQAEKYAGAEVPHPPNWGGYRLSPDSIEFWQAGANRLHDRLRYTLEPGGGWKIERLAP